MGGCKRTSFNRKMAAAGKSSAAEEEGWRTRLRCGVFQVPLSTVQGQREELRPERLRFRPFIDLDQIINNERADR